MARKSRPPSHMSRHCCIFRSEKRRGKDKKKPVLHFLLLHYFQLMIQQPRPSGQVLAPPPQTLPDANWRVKTSLTPLNICRAKGHEQTLARRVAGADGSTRHSRRTPMKATRHCEPRRSSQV